ncbi:MAG TPA: hypothetical protein VH599_07405 [Ktedonobacterales bacterium]|jgi:hypothetical protein
MERMEGEPGLYTWNVYHEPADTDELARFIGIILAETMVLALDNAAQYYEIPSYDLVVRRSDLEAQEPL